MKPKLIAIVSGILISIFFTINYIFNFLNLNNSPLAIKLFCVLGLFLLFWGVINWLISKYLFSTFLIFPIWKQLLIFMSSLVLVLLLIYFGKIGVSFSIPTFSYIIIFTFIILLAGTMLFQGESLFPDSFHTILENVKMPTGPLMYLLIFIIFFLTVNFYWFFIDKTPPWWDQSWYLHNSDFFYYSLKNQGFQSFIATFTNSFAVKAPLIALLPLPWYLLGFHNYLGEVLTFQSLVLSFFIVLYKLVSKSVGSWVAVVAVVISGTMPLVYGLSRQFLVEFGLMFLVVLWVLLLINSNYFQNDKYNIALGCVLGFGLLMKTTFPIYIIGPVIVGGAYFLFSKSNHEKNVKLFLANIFVVLTIGILVAGTWYFKNFSNVIGFGLAAGLGSLSKDYSMGNPLDINTFISFWKVVVNYGISTYYLFIGLIFLFMLILKRISIKKGSGSNSTISWGFKWILLLWFFIPFLIFSLGTNKDYRYLVPSLPALGTIIAILIFDVVRTKKAKSFVIPFICLFPIFFMLYASLPLSINHNLTIGDFVLLDSNLGGYVYRPNKNIWPLRSIITWINKDAQINFDTTKIPNPLVYLIVNHIYFNNESFGYYASLMDSNVQFRVLVTRSEAQWQEQKEIFLAAQYVITKTGDQGPAFTTYMNADLRKLLEAGELPFDEVMKFDLPDGSISTVYRRKQLLH